MFRFSPGVTYEFMLNNNKQTSGEDNDTNNLPYIRHIGGFFSLKFCYLLLFCILTQNFIAN
jgi:hypothetical protein